MRILVPVTYAIDPNVRITAKTTMDLSELTGVKTAIDPLSEIAVEEAVRAREAGFPAEVVAVAVGSSLVRAPLRRALALGADRAVVVESSVLPETLAVAKLLRALVTDIRPDVVLMGAKSIDSDEGEIGPALAGLLGWPMLSRAAKIDFAGEAAVVVQEVDSGTETWRLPFPCVITVGIRLNRPRCPTLRQIRDAGRRPLTSMSAADLRIDHSPRLSIIRTAQPAPPRRRQRVDVGELVEKLHECGAL